MAAKNYEFRLFIGSATQYREVFPLYPDTVTLEIEKESGEQFFRKKFSGKLHFVGPDFDYINAQAFDSEFRLAVLHSGNFYWNGRFYKTDCEFDLDAKVISVTPSVRDDYELIMAGLDKEFNLIELAPAITPIKMEKRPALQIYTAGESAIGCFLSGMWWEQECDVVTDSETIEVEGELVNKLTTYLHFAKIGRWRYLSFTNVSETVSPQLPDFVIQTNPEDSDVFDFSSGGFRFVATRDSETNLWAMVISQNGVVLWQSLQPSSGPESDDWDVNLYPQNGATGTINAANMMKSIYIRLMCDVEEFKGAATFPIPEDDIIGDHRNYHYVAPYDETGMVYYSADASAIPTRWGRKTSTTYYTPPDSQNLYFPIARTFWGEFSFWFRPSRFPYADEQAATATHILKDAYALDAVLTSLLSALDTSITFRATNLYSNFLYNSSTPGGLAQNGLRIFITPKSNIINSGYDQPAQKAMITLREVLNMMRDCYRCYWYVYGTRLRIEHIRYFMNGGSYTDSPSVGIDLTEILARNGKPYSTSQNKYTFDKPDMPSRYQFSWMDDVTEIFNGYPIDIVSNYVQPGNVEEISLPKFTSDVDFMLLNPGSISEEGFALLCGSIPSGDTYYHLNYYSKTIKDYTGHFQNGLCSFDSLQQYYFWDMPAPNFTINGQSYTASGTKRYKSQKVQFPAISDPNTSLLIKTEIGNGQIDKISLNLLSRNATATLKYDTE